MSGEIEKQRDQQLPERISRIKEETSLVMVEMRAIAKQVWGENTQLSGEHERRSTLRQVMRPVLRAIIADGAPLISDEDRITLEVECTRAVEDVLRRYGL